MCCESNGQQIFIEHLVMFQAVRIHRNEQNRESPAFLWSLQTLNKPEVNKAPCWRAVENSHCGVTGTVEVWGRVPRQPLLKCIPACKPLSVHYRESNHITCWMKRVHGWMAGRNAPWGSLALTARYQSFFHWTLMISWDTIRQGYPVSMLDQSKNKSTLPKSHLLR